MTPDITRTLRKLARTNSRLRADLRGCRRLLMEALVQRETPSPVRRRYSLRAVQYALILVGDLENQCERKHNYYSRLLQAPEALKRRPRDAEALERELTATFEKPRFIEGDDDRPTLLATALHGLGCLARRLMKTSTAALLRRASEIELFARRGKDALMERALDLAQTFDRRTVACRTEGERERLRDDIIAAAGNRFDPLMVGALLRMWTAVTRFADRREPLAA